MDYLRSLTVCDDDLSLYQCDPILTSDLLCLALVALQPTENESVTRCNIAALLVAIL
jgi:hypothetical protein